MQLILNEAFSKLGLLFETVTGSAFSQARCQLLHTAFIELNQKAVVEVVYSDEAYRKWHGFRLIGIDGSLIVLPDHPSVLKDFGGVAIVNQHGVLEAQRPMGLISVYYDVLNHVALSSQLASVRCYEGDLALAQLSCTRASDLLLFDRNYPSYVFLATLVKEQRHFVGRCTRASFTAARVLFNEQRQSLVVTLRPQPEKRDQIKALDLPSEITVRFVRVILSTGEVEVLVTSLCDETVFGHDLFKDLYARRWGVETFFHVLKSRLSLENFTGKRVETVRQDFYASVFLTGLESILTDEAQAILDQKCAQSKQARKVNKAVSFHAIKHHALDLLYTQSDLSLLKEQLTHLFLTNPVALRPHRKTPRKETSDRAKINYQRRVRKHSF